MAPKGYGEPFLPQHSGQRGAPATSADNANQFCHNFVDDPIEIRKLADSSVRDESEIYGEGYSASSSSSSFSANRANETTRSSFSTSIRRTPCVLRPITRMSLMRRRMILPLLVTSIS